MLLCLCSVVSAFLLCYHRVVALSFCIDGLFVLLCICVVALHWCGLALLCSGG